MKELAIDQRSQRGLQSASSSLGVGRSWSLDWLTALGIALGVASAAPDDKWQRHPPRVADALASHGGTLIWRAFVYGHSKDRAMDAYHEFTPFDGKFRDNVFIQVKNGPLDFQPHEAFNPLFGSMPHTRLAMELQITKEYLGHATKRELQPSRLLGPVMLR